jgi:hypothetical protein
MSLCLGNAVSRTTRPCHQDFGIAQITCKIAFGKAIPETESTLVCGVIALDLGFGYYGSLRKFVLILLVQ